MEAEMDELEQGSKAVAPGEVAETLLRELSDAVDLQYGGGAKLILLGGVGTSEQKPSVFKIWPKMFSEATNAAAEKGQDTSIALAPSVLGPAAGDFLLQDMHVLDMATLQWVRPSTEGTFAPARGGHTAVAVPVRVFSDEARPSAVQPAASGLPGLLPTALAAAESAAPDAPADPFGSGTPGHVVLRWLLAHVQAMRHTPAQPRAPRMQPGTLAPVRRLTAGAKAQMDALVRCMGRLSWSLGCPRPYVPVALSVDVVHALLLTRNPVGLDGREDRLGVALSVESAIDEKAEVVRGGSDPLAPSQAGTESLSRTGTRRDPSEPRFIRVADLQQIFTSNKMLPMAARCLEEATHWNHPGAHHAVVQMANLRLSPGARLPAGCDRLCLVVEINALRDIAEHPKQARRVSAEFAPTEMGAVAVDVAWELLGEEESASLVEALAGMAEAELDCRVTVRLVGRIEGVRAPGQTEDAEFDVASGTVDLSNVTASGDLDCEELALYPVAQGVVGDRDDAPAGPPLMSGVVSCFFTRAMALATRLHRKSFMDAFRIVAFGGASTTAQGEDRVPKPMGQLCVYDAVTNAWQSLDLGMPQAQEPSPRSGHASAYLQNHVYVLGGTGPSGEVLGDIVALNTVEMFWSDATPQAGEVSRTGHTVDAVPGAALFGERALLLVFGGRSDGGAVFSDAVAVDVTRLQQRALLSACSLAPAAAGLPDDLVRDADAARPQVVFVDYEGQAPEARSGHCSTLVLPRAKLDLEGLRVAAAAAPAERASAWGGHPAVGAQLFVFGGRLASGRLAGDLWCGTVVEIEARVGGRVRMAWEPLQATGPAPPPREGSSLAAVGSKLVLVDGWVGVEQAPWTRDCYVLDVSTATWTSLRFPGLAPPGRFAHAACVADFRATSSAFSSIHGDALAPAEDGLCARIAAGAPLELFVQARDALGAPCDRAGALFTAALVRPGAPGEAVAAGDVRDLGAGVYRVVVPTVQAGDFSLLVQGEDGGLVMGCPCPVTVLPGAAVPGNTVVEGLGLESTEAGRDTDLYLSLHDALGNNVLPELGAEGKVSVKIGGVERGSFGVVVERAGPRLRIRYHVEQAATVKMHVRYANREVPGSPFTVEVHPGPLSRQHSRIHGRCVNARWATRVPATIAVYACDRFGNRIRHGGDGIAVFAEHVSTDPRNAGAGGGKPELRALGEVVDNGDGTYAAELDLKETGHYLVAVQTKGRDKGHLEGSPFHVMVMAGEVDPMACEAEGPGIQGTASRQAVSAGEEATLVITAKDSKGRPIGGGNDVFKGWLARVARDDETVSRKRKEAVVMANVVDNGDGTYTMSYVPHDQGLYDLHIEGCSGFALNPVMMPVARSPYRIAVVAGSVAPGKCQADGEGIGRNPVVNGQLCQFRVHLCDLWSNPIGRGAASVACTVTTGTWNIPTEVKDNGDGTYTVSYLPDLSLMPLPKDEALAHLHKSAGVVVRVDISVNGAPILWSPFFQAVSPIGVSTAMSSLLALPTQVNSGETYRIVLQSCGPDGQELDTGGALFRVHLTGHPDAFADIQDNNNGQYLIRVLAKEAGNYDLTLEVTLGGQHVVGSPAAISVVPPGLFKAGFWTGARTMDEAAANNFVMSGMGLSSTVAGATAEFEIASRRADEQTPAGSFVAEFRPAGHEADDVYGEVSGPRKGVYTCKYRLTVAGDYSLVVKLAKFTLSGCPRVVHVDADVTHAPSCKVHGEGTSGRVLRDAEQVFFVETADRFGNPTWHPQDRIFVEVRGGRLDIFKRRGVVRVRFRKAVVHARVDRVEGNLYRCSYTLRQVGYFGVIVRHQRAGDVNWVDLGESPYEVECYRTGHDKSRMSRTTAGGFMSREFTMAGARDYHNAVAELAMRKARRIDSSSLPAVDPLADDPMERAVQTDMDLLAKSRPKRFLARLRGELDARAEAERAAAEGERRGAGWGRRVPHVPQVGPRVLDTKELKSALQKAKAEQEVEEVDTVSPMPMSRVESKGAARRRVGFGATGAQSPASRAGIFTLADAQQGLFGVGTWGQAKRALDGTGSKSGDQGSQDAQSNGADSLEASPAVKFGKEASPNAGFSRFRMLRALKGME